MLIRSAMFCSLMYMAYCGFQWGTVFADDDASANSSIPVTAKEISEKPAPEESHKRRKPLPTYYGMIGVSDAQRDKLAKIQDEYEVRLEKLRQELKQLVVERDQKLETMLTPGQKLRLKELREAARIKAQKKTLSSAKKKK